MQIDMHYYGTYALARAAGLGRETAETISTASQYVDDATHGELDPHPDGTIFTIEKTSHHPWQLSAINDADDQRHVWVPFHFIPGGEGSTLEERLICRKNSQIARAVVDHALSRATRPYACELIGVTAHCYADTFSHYGFSGVSSKLNRVHPDSLDTLNDDPLVEEILGPKLKSFFEKFGHQGGLMTEYRAIVSEADQVLSSLNGHGALGHGAVAVYPDQPYLSWSFTYQYQGADGPVKRIERENAVDYMDACRALHDMFRRFSVARPDLADGTGGREFSEIEQCVADIIGFIGDSGARSKRWLKALQGGRLTGAPEKAPTPYDATFWRKRMTGLKDLPASSEAVRTTAYRFNQAAALHRSHLLRDLLPRHGIVVV